MADGELEAALEGVVEATEEVEGEATEDAEAAGLADSTELLEAGGVSEAALDAEGTLVTEEVGEEDEAAD